MDRYRETAFNPKPENEAAMREQEERPLGFEETLEALKSGAMIVIEKNPPFVDAVKKLLKIYGISLKIPFKACEEVVEKGKFGHQWEMVIAVAKELEGAH
ncbi:MAG: hypothetical protein AAB507_01445 [Patescibacteria group bacterium]